MNRVTSFGIDKYSRWVNTFGYTDETRQLRNYMSKLAEEIYIRQFDFLYMNTIDSLNTSNWQQR